MQENGGRKYVNEMCNVSWILLGSKTKWSRSGVLGESKTGKCKKMWDENMLMKRVTQAGFNLDDWEVEFWVKVKQANARKYGTKICS